MQAQTAPRPQLRRDHYGKGGSRRRENADDLLGLTLAPRARPAPAPRRSTKNGSAKRIGVTARERFIHAQYRFLLKPNGDYTVHFCDPDIHFDWTDVLQVIVPTSSALPFNASGDGLGLQEGQQTCPICLSEPTAPRMSRCGHVYCYPCILRYLELSDTGAWHKCPVCQDSIHSKDLKSVRWFDAHHAHQLAQSMCEGALPESRKAVLTMRLVERPQITTLGLPRSTTWPSSAVSPNSAPWHFTPDAETFARFMLAPPELMLASLERDLQQIDAEERLTRTLAMASGKAVATDTDISLVFVASARRKVRDQMEKAEALKTGAVMAARKTALKDLAACNSLPVPPQPEASTYGSGSSDADELPEAYISTLRGAPSPSMTAATGKKRGNVNPPPPNDKPFMYYQVASGQNIYLSPLDLKILSAHFGDALPPMIHVPVEQHEDRSMTDDFRKRYKFLAHLPTASEITFIEANLSSLVPASALEAFSRQLRARKALRANKVRKEERDLRATAKRHQEVQSTPVIEYRLPAAEADRAIEMPALPVKLGTSPPAGPSHDASVDDDSPVERTVWGTRAVVAPSPTLAPTAAPELPTLVGEEGDEQWRAAEQEWALQQLASDQAAPQPPGSKGRRKKGIVLNLSSGGRGR